MLELPQRVIPVAGMCVGWPSEKGHISPRLGLYSTLHQGRYDEGDLAGASTPTTSAAPRSIPTSRAIPRAGARSAFYGWSEDKARQYGVPQRADFGAFVRKKGFNLD